MTTYTKLTASVAAYTLTSTILASTATSVTLALSDGTTLVLTGSGFVVTGGQMTAGTVSLMAHKSAALVDIETWTAIPVVAATVLQANLTPSINTDGFFSELYFANDTFIGNSSADSLKGYAGIDFFRGLAGNDTIDGGDGSNDMAAYDNDSIGGGGAGVVVNLSSSAVFVGGSVASGTARDGYSNTDTLIGIEEARGTNFADNFFGGTGYNWFQGRGGADAYGSSVVRYSANYFLNGFAWVDYRQDGGANGVVVNFATGAGTDTFGNAETFSGITAVRASLFADTLTGDQYYNQFQGLQGNDTINGAGGYDRVDYSVDFSYGGSLGVNVNLGTGVATDGWGNTDTLTNIEEAVGTAFNDTLTGNAWDNDLRGLSGNDSLTGSDGNDSFRPGLGQDTVNGSPLTNPDQAFDDRDRVDYSDLVSDQFGLGVIVNFSTTSATFETFVVAGNTARDTGGSTDTLIDIERVRGTSRRDYFLGSDTANLREERFEGLRGGDYIDGGAGYNVANYLQETANFGGAGFGGTLGVIANLSQSSITTAAVTIAAGTARDGFGDTDTLFNIRGIWGTALADYVVGGAGYDFFRGYTGADFFDGGAGTTDRISFFFDELFFGTTGAGVVVNMVAGTATNFVDASTTTFVNVENVDGSERNDSITGDANNNSLFGDYGNDTINGGDGNDTVSGGEGADSLIGGNGIDIVSYNFDPTVITWGLLQRPTIYTAVATGVNVNLQTGVVLDAYGDSDTISGFEGVTGTFFNDTLTGDSNDNIFYGLSGNDTISGVGGIDTVSYAGWGVTDGSGAPALVGINASRPNGVNVNLTTNTANDAEGGTDTFTSIENVIGSTGNDTIVGSAVANILTGGLGNDDYTIDNLDTIVELVSEGTDTMRVNFGTLVMAANVENLLFVGYSGATNVSGNAEANSIIGTNASNSFNGLGGNDTLVGGTASDVLVGGLGADSMTGGDGGDFYYVDDANDVIVEGAGGASGYDIVTITNGNYVLSANIEQAGLQDGGTGVTGNALGNFLYGGGSGLSLSINGADGDDILFAGLAGGNTLIGGAGTDTLLIYGGNNQANGGLGSDIYYTYTATDVLSELGGDGIDTVYSTHSLTVGDGLEQILLSGSAVFAISTSLIDNNIMYGVSTTGAVSLDGGGGSDVLIGGNFNDTLVGGAGVDLLFGYGGTNDLQGGSETDIYYLDNNTTTVTELLGGGFDTMYSQAAGTTTMAANVEQLILYGAATGGTGSAEDNYLYGNASTFALTLDGAGGNDYLLGSAQADVLIGGAGNDTINLSPGATGDDLIRYATGNMGSDTVLSFDADPTGGQDRIDLSGLGYSGANIGGTITIANAGGNTLVTFGGVLAGTTITLVGVASATVDATDFKFI